MFPELVINSSFAEHDHELLVILLLPSDRCECRRAPPCLRDPVLGMEPMASCVLGQPVSPPSTEFPAVNRLSEKMIGLQLALGFHTSSACGTLSILGGHEMRVLRTPVKWPPATQSELLCCTLSRCLLRQG